MLLFFLYISKTLRPVNTRLVWWQQLVTSLLLLSRLILNGCLMPTQLVFSAVLFFIYFLNIAQLLVQGADASGEHFVIRGHWSAAPQLLDVGNWEKCSWVAVCFFFSFFFMFAVNQWMPPNYCPSTPHCTLIARHKGSDSVRRCIGQTRFYSK